MPVTGQCGYNNFYSVHEELNCSEGHARSSKGLVLGGHEGRIEEKVNDTEADHIPLSKVSSPQMLILGCAMSWRLLQGCSLASPIAAGTPSLNPKR